MKDLSLCTLIQAHFYLILLSIPFLPVKGSYILLSMHPLNPVTFEIGLICDFLTPVGPVTSQIYEYCNFWAGKWSFEYMIKMT
jgi:hypothetical protein